MGIYREIKSHVQANKGILKQFSHKTEEGKFVYSLDINTLNISECNIKKLGVINGYFDTAVKENESSNYKSIMGAIK